MVYRVYVEKKRELAQEAESLKNELKEIQRISNLKDLRIINRYDVENIDEDLFNYCKKTVFSEPQLDIVSDEIDTMSDASFVVEFLPGQFDQRADSAEQCIQIISQKDRPIVRTAKVYLLYGAISNEDLEKIKKYVINPVESREASFERFDTLLGNYDTPNSVGIVDGFNELSEDELTKLLNKEGLSMDLEDIKCCQKYFISEKRNPTITEIKMIDNYWSDHCRHSTFLTVIENITFEDEEIENTYKEYLSVRKELNRTKPVSLMDLGTIVARFLKVNGRLDKLDESDEINACTVKIKVDVAGKQEDWLLLFKNETHNHPTEIEPFGGAATCIGGAIRDPLSGRAYVYSAMRVTGAGNPLTPIEETIKGKLPQRKIVTTAAAGYSSYGNQIGLATGQVDEIYHEGYVAKRMEIGAVIGAAPKENVVRKEPTPGDVIFLLGGRTGRDGCGAATGSSKSHTTTSLNSCGAEVQKGNAPEERKLQRLFRNKEATRLIKRCNDFGAGGVSVAIGELADGLTIDLNKVPKKYEGLDGTELAISESQERMAVVVSASDAEKFADLAKKENLEATIVASVTKEARLVMNWNGKNIVDISREFLNSNGADKHINVAVAKSKEFNKLKENDFKKAYYKLAEDLNVVSKRGLVERFDSTIGKGTVLFPFGGKNQLTPIQAMVNKVCVEGNNTKTCSVMAWGFNPYISEKSQYHGAYLSVVESVSKLIATGAEFTDVYLTFQEYYEKLGQDKYKWGKPVSALLGAFKAQKELGIAAIGGKDSMSGTFENMNVPPTLVSFAVTTEDIDNIISPEFKKAGNKIVLLKPEYSTDGLPKSNSLIKIFTQVTELIRQGKAISVYTPGFGGIAEGIFKMCIGNKIGFKYEDKKAVEDLFSYSYGSFILELSEDIDVGEILGETTLEPQIVYKDEAIEIDTLLTPYEEKLESVYPCNITKKVEIYPEFNYFSTQKISPRIKTMKPKVLIPVFPGTNCEYDTESSLKVAGAEAKIIVIRNLTSSDITESVNYFAQELKTAQMVVIPGGFSGADEPDGSGKFICAFFRNQKIKEGIHELLKMRDGLMCGICNGFQALIKLGLIQFGEIVDIDETSPTLTYNTIARHQSKIVRIRVASNKSPWLQRVNVSDIVNVPVSHGEGRLIATNEQIEEFSKNGQIATQYVDLEGNPTSDIHFNPNNSVFAIEGLTSPDGRILGKMGHAERIGYGLYKNIPGNYDMKIFESAVEYFR